MSLTRFLDPKNDVAFKKIFGSEKNQDILIHFLNDILEFKGNSEITDVEFLSPVQDPEIASKKQSIVDVLCKDGLGVQYIIEMQVAPSEGFEKRAQYYAAKAYCRQTNKGRDEDGKYSNLKEIIFIAITDYILFPKKDRQKYISRHVILDKHSYEHDLKDFSFTFIELPKFTKDKVEQLDNIVEKWCYYFKHAQKTTPDELQQIIGSDLVIKRAYEALAQFNWTEAELDSYEQELKRVWDNRAVEEYRTNQMEAKIKQAEDRMQRTEARIKQAAEQMKQSETQIKLSEAQIKQAAEQMKQSEARIKQAEARIKQTEVAAEVMGEARGIQEEKRGVARKMLAKNRPLNEIIEFTGLTKEEIEKL